MDSITQYFETVLTGLGYSCKRIYGVSNLSSTKDSIDISFEGINGITSYVDGSIKEISVNVTLYMFDPKNESELVQFVNTLNSFTGYDDNNLGQCSISFEGCTPLTEVVTENTNSIFAIRYVGTYTN